jgi:PadR family transcriptional regulator AphA
MATRRLVPQYTPAHPDELAHLRAGWSSPSGPNTRPSVPRSRPLGHVWRIKQSQLSARLARLEEAGFLASTVETQDTRPPRKVLHLTPVGEAAFKSWLITPVQHGRDFRLDSLAKLFFANRDPGDALVLLFRLGQLDAILDWLANCETELAHP